jgi:hypothetical protein
MNALSLVPIPKNDREDNTLAGLVERLEARDSESNPDRTVHLSKVRMTVDGTLVVPSVHGSFAMTEWARGQLSRAVGVTWDRYFSNARPTDVAEEMNRRFSRATETVKLRSVSRVTHAIEATGTITALVGPDYSPVPDAVIGNVLRDALATVNQDTKILRCTTTDLTTNYVVRVGERLTPNAEVGAVEGCLYVRNSGVGFAKLVVGIMLHRLACKNGLIVSLPGAGPRRGPSTEASTSRRFVSASWPDFRACPSASTRAPNSWPSRPTSRSRTLSLRSGTCSAKPAFLCVSSPQ